MRPNIYFSKVGTVFLRLKSYYDLAMMCLMIERDDNIIPDVLRHTSSYLGMCNKQTNKQTPLTRDLKEFVNFRLQIFTLGARLTVTFTPSVGTRVLARLSLYCTK